MADIPKLSKRLYDARLFSVDVSGKLRDGDEVTTFDNVEVAARKGEPTLPTVAVAVPAISGDNNEIINFTCSGGESGGSYIVSLRYVATNETALESIIQVDVI